MSRQTSPGGGFLFRSALPLSEIAHVLVRFNHVASFIVNANHQKHTESRNGKVPPAADFQKGAAGALTQFRR